jgi:hypothetical protein
MAKNVLTGSVECDLLSAFDPSFVEGTNSGIFRSIARTGGIDGDVTITMEPGFEFSPRATIIPAALHNTFAHPQVRDRAADGSWFRILVYSAPAVVFNANFSITLQDVQIG